MKKRFSESMLETIDAALRSKEMNLGDLAREYGVNRSVLSTKLTAWRKQQGEEGKVKQWKPVR